MPLSKDWAAMAVAGVFILLFVLVRLHGESFDILLNPDPCDGILMSPPNSCRNCKIQSVETKQPAAGLGFFFGSQR